jgi:hypothetical protein
MPRMMKDGNNKKWRMSTRNNKITSNNKGVEKAR